MTNSTTHIYLNPIRSDRVEDFERFLEMVRVAVDEQRLALVVYLEQGPVHSRRIVRRIFNHARVCKLVCEASEYLPLHDADNLRDIFLGRACGQHARKRRTGASSGVTWAAIRLLDERVDP